MRQDGTHKVFMNHVIETSTKLLPHGDAGNSYVYKAVDFAEGAAGKSETFAVKFKDAANAELFQAAFIKNQVRQGMRAQ